jgi:hypothetical protein
MCHCFRSSVRVLLATFVMLGLSFTPGASVLANTTAAGSTGRQAASNVAVDDTGLLLCSETGDGDWTTTSATFEVIRQCTLVVPESGSVYLSASASVGLSDGGQAYKADFRLGLDPIAGDAATDRRVSIDLDSGDGQDKSVMATHLMTVTAGAHTIYFLGRRDTGPGTVQLHDPSLSAVYFPDSLAEVKTCGAAADDTWTTTQNTFQEIRHCTLDLPESGSVYLSGSAGVELADGGSAYQGAFQLGVDDATGDLDSVRLVDISPDSGDGSREVVATALFKPAIITGTHTFYFSGERYSGSSVMQVHDASLSVLFFPASSIALTFCGKTTYGLWSSISSAYSTIRWCNLSLSRNGRAFVEASAWTLMTDPGTTHEWEGHFRLGLDDMGGSANYDRQVNAYDSQGGQRIVADSGVFAMEPGNHTSYFVGSRTTGPGTAVIWAASLFVLNVPDLTVYLPLILK